VTTFLGVLYLIWGIVVKETNNNKHDKDKKINRVGL